MFNVSLLELRILGKPFYSAPQTNPVTPQQASQTSPNAGNNGKIKQNTEHRSRVNNDVIELDGLTSKQWGTIQGEAGKEFQ